MHKEIEKGSLVDVVGLAYQAHNLILRQATVMKDNDDGTFDVRVLSEINGFIELKDVALQDLKSAILY